MGFLAVLCIDTPFAQDCVPADISLSNQQSIDTFQQDYGPCDVVAENLTIIGNDITNPKPETVEVGQLNKESSRII